MATMRVVESVDDERNLGHGWWFYLKPGWRWVGYNTHCIHRDTKRECLEELRINVEPCDCADCLKAKQV